MALARVQATGKIVSSAGSNSFAFPFASPPTVGHGVILVCNHSGTTQDTSCTDNYSNTYTLVLTHPNPSSGNAIDVWYCPAITATGAALTLTTTFGTTVPEWRNRMGVAIEANGSLAVDQLFESAEVAWFEMTAGPTPSFTADDVLVITSLMLGASGTDHITLTAATPPWIQEAEHLGGGQGQVGEIDSRVRTGATGATETVAWNWGGGIYAVTIIVAFKAGAPALVAVPDVVTDLEAAAVAEITAAGLTVGMITTAVSATVAAGHVMSQSPVAGTLVAPGAAVDLTIAVAAGLVVTINGVPQRILHDSLSIQATINGRDRLSATLPLPTVAPDVRQEIVVTYDGVRIFGGLIDTVTERAATSKTDVPSQLYAITAADFNAIADWRYIDGISGPAETLKYALTALVAYMPGVTLNPAQVDGPGAAATDLLAGEGLAGPRRIHHHHRLRVERRLCRRPDHVGARRGGGAVRHPRQ